MVLNNELNTYAAIETGTYALQRDFNASTRLTAQHYLWKDALKFDVHPSIPLCQEDIKIADVATDNRIWLLDLAQKLPATAKLHGFDISLDQCSPRAWLPENVDFHTWDVFEEPAAEFVETFDVVHIRLITVAVSNNDPTPILKNLHRLLKPGGYIQWDEADNVDWTVKSVDPSIKTNALQGLFQQLCGTHDWKRHLQKTMNENGFHDALIHRVEYDKTMARLWNDMYMSTWEEFAKVVLKTPDVSSQLGRYAMSQVREGSAIWCAMIVWVAQKV